MYKLILFLFVMASLHKKTRIQNNKKMQQNNNNPYKCLYCNKTYKVKQNHDRHYLVCDLLYKTVRERANEEQGALPSQQVMYNALIDLTGKYSLLEKKVDELMKWTESQKRKLNILDWLNEKYPNALVFSEWLLGGVQVERNQLEVVFKSDYINGMVKLIEYNLLADNLSSLRAFDQKENILFIFCRDDNNGKKWKVMDTQEFITLINVMNKKLMGEFITWQKENKERMYEEEFSTIYASNVQKLMCASLSQEQIHSRIKRELYKTIKMNLKNIIEYEFSL